LAGHGFATQVFEVEAARDFPRLGHPLSAQQHVIERHFRISISLLQPGQIVGQKSSREGKRQVTLGSVLMADEQHLLPCLRAQCLSLLSPGYVIGKEGRKKGQSGGQPKRFSRIVNPLRLVPIPNLIFAQANRQ
jgi:hypothetical protein